MMNKTIYSLLFIISVIFIAGCSSSKESYDRENNYGTGAGASIRVLLDEQNSGYNWLIKTPVYLKESKGSLALINSGNTLSISNKGNEINLDIEGKRFTGKDFLLAAAEPGTTIDYGGKPYRGALKIISDGNEIKIVNVLSLEQYLKGVIPHEMPKGKGTEYYEALKAFTICARTYTILKLNENKDLFDVFSDTRDQVYGGCGLENDAMNKIVDDTQGLILTYDDKPAITLYSSTCGGYTEDAVNVFKKIDAPYLKGIKDGDSPYCSVSPKYMWTETFKEQTFVQRFISSGYLDDDRYTLSSVKANSFFKSGRINELELDFINNQSKIKSVKLYGNNIRYIIRTADNKSILESNNFDIRKDSYDNIIIKGKGYGHGVGLCQWGALEQSREGKTYEEILYFYYPGTTIESYND